MEGRTGVSELAIYGWAGPPIEDPRRRAEAFKEVGLTVVDWEPDALDMLGDFGLKAMVHKPSVETVKGIAAQASTASFIACPFFSERST